MKDKVRKERGGSCDRDTLPDVLFSVLCDDALAHSAAKNSDRVTQTITREEIRNWLTAQAGSKDWKPASISRYQAAVSLTSRVAIDHDPPKMPRNPTTGIRRKREKNVKVR